jgi:hypothetical protein
MVPPFSLMGQFYAANVTGMLQSGEFPVNPQPGDRRIAAAQQHKKLTPRSGARI